MSRGRRRVEMNRNWLNVIVMSTLAGAMSLAATGCGRTEHRGPLEQAGHDVDHAAQQAEHDVNHAAHDVDHDVHNATH
jgi:Ni/Co efflux regulator RcnB